MYRGLPVTYADFLSRPGLYRQTATDCADAAVAIDYSTTTANPTQADLTMTTSPANTSRFSIAIDGMEDGFRLTAITGESSISNLYQYDISCASKQQKIDLQSLLNRSALVSIRDPACSAEPRYLHGIISAASYLNHGKEYNEYRIRLVPPLWRLTQRSNFRIFQDTTPNRIISTILKEHSIVGDLFRDQTRAAKPRNYCTQYGETDYQFIVRLMAEEGWHFHFQHSSTGQTMVLADSNREFKVKSGDPRLRFEQETSRPQDEECIHRLDSRHLVTIGAVRLGDFNFEKPNLPLQEIQQGIMPALEQYDFPGHFDTPARGEQLSQIRLQQAAASAHLVAMETHSVHCESGQYLELEQHPNPQLNQRYLVVGSALEGEQPQSLDSGASNRPARCISRLICIPYATAFQPNRQCVRPRVPGPHNAIVTGPGGEEIYTDKQGRIKVQFYWDREGRANEHTSCWLRVNQPLTGMQWGGIALPRIGQEVIVDFEHGDPDRPLMTGRVYNAQNMPPYDLPHHKTRSTFKSLSSPGGDGYHEIRIEDRKNQEQIFLRAEKDLDLRVLHDLKSQTEGHQHLSVGNLLAEEIKLDLHSSTQGNCNEDTGQNLSITVGKDLQLKVSGAHVIQAGNAIHIKAGNKAVLQAAMSLSVKAGAGFITLDPSGVAIMGPLVRINEGGGGSSARAANPTQPGTPAEADNDVPGARLQAATGATIPLAPAIDLKRRTAQLAALQEADALQSPFVEECPECELFAQQEGSELLDSQAGLKTI